MPRHAIAVAAAVCCASLPAAARATDALVCRSNTYGAELAVGTDGTVASLVLSDETGKRVPQPTEVTALEPKHRTASFEHRSVDVEARTGLRGADRLVIRLEHGRGYVELGGDVEVMACDFAR